MGTPVPSDLPLTSAAALMTEAAELAAGEHGRLLPVGDPLAAVLPDGGLVRGRTVACTGPAAPTVALLVAARATATGSWMAVIGLPWLGVEAARELGVALERMVAVDADVRSAWAECVAAAVDGFDVVLAAPPPGARDLRRVAARLRTRGGVLVLLDDRSRRAGAELGADVTVSASTEAWEGISRGHGRLTGRRLRLTVAGRRTPHPRTAILPQPLLTMDRCAG